MMDDSKNNGQTFQEWFKTQFVLPYAYRMPDTISFLCNKLEIEDVTKHLAVRSSEQPTKVSKKRPRLQMKIDTELNETERIVKIANPAQREEQQRSFLGFRK